MPSDVRNLPVIEVLKAIIQTLMELLQHTKEQLIQAEAKIKSLEDELR
jgi:hypothetical protein